MGHPYDVERATELHIDWCLDLARRLGLTTTHQSGPQMRAVMHELRDALSPECVARVANAFPALERGIFIEGWGLNRNGNAPRDAEEFADRVYRRVAGHHARIDDLVPQVFGLWRDRLGEKADEIQNCLPAYLRPLWPG